MMLKAMELYGDGTKEWAVSAASAFDKLKTDECRDAPKPEWWNDEALRALSARVVAVAPDEPGLCSMRAHVLQGNALGLVPWKTGPRTAEEIKEAATWHKRASKRFPTPADARRYEGLARQCDEVADPLLAKVEAEAAKARAAAEVEAAKARAAAKAEVAEALKVAEAKAAAAAEELLAEEETEKEQASTKAGKAKQSKGKTGKGAKW